MKLAKSLYQSFFSILKYSNYKVLKCVKLAFTLYSVTKNMGSIIAIIYFIIYLIFSIIYLLKGRKQLNKDLTKITKEKIEKKNLEENITTKNIAENKKQDIKSFKEINHKKNKRKIKLKIIY